MVEQKLVVTCNSCGSKNVSFTEEFYAFEFRRVTDYSLDHSWLQPSKILRFLKCHCNKCGKDYEENLGTEFIPLTPGNIEL